MKATWTHVVLAYIGIALALIFCFAFSKPLTPQQKQAVKRRRALRKNAASGDIADITEIYRQLYTRLKSEEQTP